MLGVVSTASWATRTLSGQLGRATLSSGMCWPFSSVGGIVQLKLHLVGAYLLFIYYTSYFGRVIAVGNVVFLLCIDLFSFEVSDVLGRVLGWNVGRVLGGCRSCVELGSLVAVCFSPMSRRCCIFPGTCLGPSHVSKLG